MMMQLTLAIPSLLWPHTEAPLPVFNMPGLNALRRWGHWQVEAIDTAAFYGRYLWHKSPIDIAKRELGLAAEETCFLCSPVSQQIGMHQAQCIDGLDLALDENAAKAFCAVLNDFFRPDGWHFLPWQPTRWIVQVPQPLAWSAPSLLNLAGVIQSEDKPIGKDAMLLLQRQTEIQMLLYQHSLNQTRQQQGLPPINGVWVESQLSGTAASQPLLLSPDTWALPPSAYRGISDFDEILSFMADQTNSRENTVLFLSELRSKVNQGDAFAYQAILQNTDQHWFSPLRHALQEKRIKQLNIVTDGANGGCLKVCKPLITPFWRQSAPFNGGEL